MKYRPQIESGEYKVITRNNDAYARIVCWDADSSSEVKSGCPIVAVMEGFAHQYDENGHLMGVPADQESMFDLFVEIPEVETVELPRWKKAEIDDKGWRFYAGRCLYHDGYTLSLDDLLALPKDE